MIADVGLAAWVVVALGGAFVFGWRLFARRGSKVTDLSIASAIGPGAPGDPTRGRHHQGDCQRRRDRRHATMPSAQLQPSTLGANAQQAGRRHQRRW